MKHIYEAPDVQVIDMELQGIIAGSFDTDKIPEIPSIPY